MPRVGSSRMRTFGRAASQRARTTFCWLPPDSLPTSWSSEGVRTRSRSTYSPAMRRSRPPLHEVEAAEATEDRQRGILQDAADEDQALALAVLGREADPLADGVVGLAHVDGPAVHLHDAGSRAGSSPKITLASSVRPAPTRPAKSHDLARMDAEGDAVMPVAVDVLYLAGRSWSVAARRRRNTSDSSRPTMRRTISRSVSSAAGRTATSRPSRRMATRSARRRISRIRCET